MSTNEMLTTFGNGNTLALINEEIFSDFVKLLKYIDEVNVTNIFMTPSLLNGLLVTCKSALNFE